MSKRDEQASHRKGMKMVCKHMKHLHIYTQRDMFKTVYNFIACNKNYKLNIC